MNRTKFQRLMALMLCLTVIVGCFTVTTFATDEPSSDKEDSGSSSSGSLDSIYDSSEVLELLNAIDYGEYLEEVEKIYKKDHKQTVVVDAINDLYFGGITVGDKEVSGTDAKYEIGTYGGVEAVLTPENGTVAWKVEVPEKGLYTITIHCYAHLTDEEYKTVADSVERVFMINGKVPFSEARYLTIKKNWVNDYAKGKYIGDEKDLNKILEEGKIAGLTGEITKGKSADGKKTVETLEFDYPDDGVWTSKRVAFCEKYGIRFLTLDINENEIRPTAFQDPVWNNYVLADSTGFYADAFTFALDEGVNIISLDGKNCDLAIESITLAPAAEDYYYEDYLKDLGPLANKAGKGSVKLEAEYTATASDKTIYPLEDAADALTSPHDPSRAVLNTMGGEKWQNANQSVSYKFQVDESGMYDIITRYKQNVLDGMFVNRALYIYSEGVAEGEPGYYNGVPFKEAQFLTYNFKEAWQVTQATDGEQSFKFYFVEGKTYTIEFKVTLGSMTEIINTVQESLDSINADYLAILQLTGSTPDTYRDYGFSRIMPDVLIDMVTQAKVLDNDSETNPGVAQQLTALAGEKSSNVATLQKVSEILLDMGRDEDEIARLLSRLKSYIGTLGTFLSDAKTQPLQVDYILIQAHGAEEPKATANIFVSFFHEVARFYHSFFRNYDNIGMMKETGEDSLEVWLATGRDQTQVKRNLINTYFTKDTGIAVDLKLVAAGTLLPSILAQKGPDVYHGLDQGSVINYAIRNAILPVDGFEDFEEVAGLLKDENGNTVNKKGEIIEAQFNEASMIVLKMEDANGVDHYYGLPEAQGFAMMFVRVDILADLGIDVPRTWDDIMAAIPKLQAKNMQMGLTTDSTIHLYQMGGELFADEGMRINYDSPVGLASFKKTCDLFTSYSFPYQYDAANRFRTGEMPIVIADYTGLYNQLKVFATELEGAWVMVPVPGVQLPEGELDPCGNDNINNYAIAAVTASVLVKGCEEDRKDDAWEYIKWFTGEDCQSEYANEMVALMGPSAKYNTANVLALKKLTWTSEELARIEAQFNELAAVPNYPGRYIVARYTEFAFLAAYNDGADPAQAIRGYVDDINKEITRKRAEFGLETLEQGETLADRRLNQASNAAAQLKSKNATKYSDLVKDVELAVKSRDSATLRALSEDAMKMTEEYKDIYISKGPDITKFSEKQLLYYMSVALEEAADAIDSY